MNFSLLSIFVSITMIAILTAVLVQFPEAFILPMAILSFFGFLPLPFLMLRATLLATDLRRNSADFQRTLLVLLICLVICLPPILALSLVHVGWL